MSPHAWAEHVAGEMPLPEWLRSLVDRAISEHTCEECASSDEDLTAT